ncbi:MAG: hypothetical protein KKB03_04290, partial [Nanoarchaeota archaeon]|nr:hypothetical protein [Nanoarchaeota archaeon]
MKLKGMTGAAKIGAVFALFLFVVTLTYLGTTASANTHYSHADVTPQIVKGGDNYLFTAIVYNDGRDPISEFRIYNNTAEQNGGLTPFTKLICNPVVGWNGP